MGSTMVPFLSCFLWLLTRPKCSLIGPFLCMMRRGDNNPKQLATPSEVNGPWSPPAQGSKTWGSKTFSRAWPWSWANYYWTWTLNGLGPVTYADLFFSFFFFVPLLSCLVLRYFDWNTRDLTPMDAMIHEQLLPCRLVKVDSKAGLESWGHGLNSILIPHLFKRLTRRLTDPRKPSNSHLPTACSPFICIWFC